MAETPKKIFGIDVAATAWTTLYHPTTIQNAIVSTICICNRGLATTVRLSHGTNASAQDTDYILYETPIEANSSIFLTIGLCVSNNDYILGYANTTDVTFIGWGVEVT